MTYYYDQFGWLTTVPNGRETEIAPPPIAGAPIVGQPWPNFIGDGWVLETYSLPPAPSVQYALDLVITAASMVAAVNTPVSVIARLYAHGTQNVAPLTVDFHVPILDAEGAVAAIQLVSFANGVATPTLTFPTSSYYSINEASLNLNLPFGQQIYFPTDFKLTVYQP